MMRMYEEVAAASEGEIHTRLGGKCSGSKIGRVDRREDAEVMPPIEWRR